MLCSKIVIFIATIYSLGEISAQRRNNVLLGRIKKLQTETKQFEKFVPYNEKKIKINRYNSPKEPDLTTSDDENRNTTIRKNARVERSQKNAGSQVFIKKFQFKEQFYRQGNQGAPRVLDGVLSNRGQWPWQALVKMPGGRFCGGVLIHSCYVLTARHCTQPYRKDQINVVLGELDRGSNEGYEQHRKVLHIYEHPNFDGALLFLDRAISMGSVYKVNKIDIASSVPPAGTLATVSGWGWTDHQINSPSSKLRHAQLPIITLTTCAATLNPFLNSPINSNDVCAGSSSSGNACHGDSGGPLVYHDGSTWKLIGIVNRGAPYCPSNIHFAVYLSVPSIQSWINGIVPSSSAAAGAPCNCIPPLKKFDGTNVFAQYDRANCYIGPAHPGCDEHDKGNKLFVYQNRFYIRSHKANKCPIGTWDTCNCRIRDLFNDPPEFTDFILNNKRFYTKDFPEGNCLPGFTHDSVNCHYLDAPWGTKASKWNNAWYTTAQATCDSSMGTWFDAANCYWKGKPSNGLIKNNAYYVYAGSGNSCSEGTFNGQLCYIRHAPFGTEAFEWGGNWYHTPRRTCDDGQFDGANCRLMNPPPGATAFVWKGSYYYGWF